MKKFVLVLSFILVSVISMGQVSEKLGEDVYYNVVTSFPPEEVSLNNGEETLPTLGYVNKENDSLFVRLAFLSKPVVVMNFILKVVEEEQILKENYSYIDYICIDKDYDKLHVQTFRNGEVFIIVFNSNFFKTTLITTN